jgi:hypothetical protein
MGKKRSSLIEPRWHRKSDPEEKLHPMSVKHWINLEKMIWLAYDNCYPHIESKGESSYKIRMDTQDEHKITCKIFEGELRNKIFWEGADYFEKASYDMEVGSERYEYAKAFVKKLYPKWFRTNATNFIMET